MSIGSNTMIGSHSSGLLLSLLLLLNQRFTGWITDHLVEIAQGTKPKTHASLVTNTIDSLTIKLHSFRALVTLSIHLSHTNTLSYNSSHDE